MGEIASLKDLNETISKLEKIYIYGAGKVTEAIIGYLDNERIVKVKGIIVSNFYSNKKTVKGIEVVQADSVIDKSVAVLVGTIAKYKDEIIENLENNKYENYITLSDEFIEFILENKKIKDKAYELSRRVSILENQIDRLTPRKRIRSLVVNICDHCNLNCRGCDHFSPIADKVFYDASSIEKDLRRLHDIIGEKIDTIGVMGGEPLLHPNLCDILSMIRSIFPSVRILLCSNGIALLNQTDEFWDCCKIYSIEINITKYPVNFDYDAAEKKASEKGVSYQYYHGGMVEKTLGHYPLDLEGTQDATESFINCFHANNTCNMIFKGRLYPCTVAPCTPIFNKKYGTNIPLTEKDGIDIYEVEDEMDLFNALSRPMPICSYCKTCDRTFGYEWGQSEGKITEWT